MKKLTDASVAKALGWRSLEPGAKNQRQHYWCSSRGLDGTQVIGPPAFTTSLDAIVGEIEARGLGYNVDKPVGGKAFAQIFDAPKMPGTSTHKSARGKTAPLALCAALLSYLEARP